ncbi:acetate uptake transporter family protein [Ascoidea rubescens DSM 1968]|uniref:Putative transmembrane protein n=1 Tax=Ascoidea rubescens DSM 1968 TaxID=1344418 RepID=A0A1D2VQU8_9ASCO|nr:putative transmembrane protein [Ascoidea rubescens DSM 1968]ODV63981.1 putative transmembrane protein [Ascoidea rubescens DSM 1968]
MSDVEKNISHSGDEHQPITTSGAQNEFVHIGNMKVRKDELLNAFGGSLYPGIMAPPTHKFANPGPLGLSAFALTTFVLSMVNARAMGIHNPKVVVGLAFFYGGFIQLCAGMWEIAVENTFGGTALSSYGGFWMSYAAIQTDAFGIASSYDDETELANAIAFYLLGWTIFTAMITVCTMKSTVAFFGMFFLLTITFLLLTIGDFTRNENCTRAGGVLGVIVAFMAWYNAYAGIATPQNSYLTVKPVFLPGGRV